MEVLKHFVKEYVDSIQLGDIGTFWSIGTFGLNIMHGEVV